MQSSAGLVSQEKRLMNSHLCDVNQDQHSFCNTGGNLSPGASSLIGSQFDAQNHHIHHHADNKSTLGALSRANYRGRLYNTQPVTNEDIEKDSITNSTDTTKDLNILNRIDHQRNKKLSWQHEDFPVGSCCFNFYKKKINLKLVFFYYFRKTTLVVRWI